MDTSSIIALITFAVVMVVAVLLVVRSKRLREKEYATWLEAYRATTPLPETDPVRLRELWSTDLRSAAQARAAAAATPGYPQVDVASGAVVYAAPPTEPQTNTLALLSFIFCLLGGLLGIVFGHIALSQIKRTGENGRGLAIAGLVIGYGWIAGFLSFLVVAFTVSSLRGAI